MEGNNQKNNNKKTGAFYKNKENDKKTQEKDHKKNINSNTYSSSIEKNEIKENNYALIEEHQNTLKKQSNQQLQCQEQLNMQLYLKRQKNFSNTFKNCYNSMNDYIKNPINAKGNFLWTLQAFCAMVNLWKNEYPDYEPKLNKEFNKEQIKQQLKQFAKLTENNNNYDSRLFDKFYHLLNGENQEFENDDEILKYFPDIKSNESNVMSNANNLIEINRKIARENEKEEFYNYPNYEVDEKIKHLRLNKK